MREGSALVVLLAALGFAGGVESGGLPFPVGLAGVAVCALVAVRSTSRFDEREEGER